MLEIKELELISNDKWKLIPSQVIFVTPDIEQQMSEWIKLNIMSDPEVSRTSVFMAFIKLEKHYILNVVYKDRDRKIDSYFISENLLKLTRKRWHLQPPIILMSD